MSVVIEGHDLVSDGGNFTCPSGSDLLLVASMDYFNAGLDDSAYACTYNSVSMDYVCTIYKNIGGVGAARMSLWAMANPPTGSSYVVDVTDATPIVGLACVALSGTDAPNRQSRNLIGQFYRVAVDGDTDGGDKTMTVRGSNNGKLIDFFCGSANDTPDVGASGEQTILDSGSHYAYAYTDGDGEDATLSWDSKNNTTRPVCWIIVDVPPARDFGNHYKINIDSFYVNATHSNLQIPIYGTFDNTCVADLRSFANGGKVKSQHYCRFARDRIIPADVIFTSDAKGETQLDHVVVDWDSSTGYFYAWVKVPSLSSSTDTTIYMWVGDSDAGVGESDIMFSGYQYITLDGGKYSYVYSPYYSIAQLSSTATTTHTHKGTLSGSASFDTSNGKMGQCLSLSGGTDGLQHWGGNASSGLAESTVFSLFNTDGGGDEDQIIFRSRNAYGYEMYEDTSSNELACGAKRDYGGTGEAVSGGTISEDTWHLGASVWSVSAGYHYLYLDGVQVDSESIGTANRSKDSNAIANLGEKYDGTQNFSGYIEIAGLYYSSYTTELKTIYDLIMSQSNAVEIILDFTPRVMII